MGSFLLDLGNSNDGPIGMVLRVNADSKAEAVEVARKTLTLVAGDCGHIAVNVPFSGMDAAPVNHRIAPWRHSRGVR